MPLQFKWNIGLLERSQLQVQKQPCDPNFSDLSSARQGNPAYIFLSTHLHTKDTDRRQDFGQFSFAHKMLLRSQEICRKNKTKKYTTGFACQIFTQNFTQ